MKLIVGLGNIGAEYEGTRHNVGFSVIDHLASQQGWTFKKAPFLASWCKGILEDSEVVLLKPHTFMNRSGEAVGAAVHFYKISPTAQNLIIISDDIDLPLGQLRIRTSGGDGGHKGLTSIIGVLGTAHFTRLRVGIGRPAMKNDVTDHVLSPFTKGEREIFGEVLDRGLEALSLLIRGEIEKAMRQYNG